ncbi:MAG: hypothetical protein KAX30_04305 [Candidatus Atribacteria bacterium]|nr:hypothetical protein [Candidatus Atribacteria bacterium]
MHYKSELKDQIIKLINEFLTEERSNRVTSNNIIGLTARMGTLFEANKVEEKLKKNDK